MSATEGKIVLGPGEGKTIPVPGHSITHKLRGEDTGGAFSLLEVDLFGDGPPQHIHKTEDETFYVLEGEINVLMGKDVIKATAGSFVFVPAAGLDVTDTEAYVAKAQALAKKYNMEVVGPPLKP